MTIEMRQRNSLYEMKVMKRVAALFRFTCHESAGLHENPGPGPISDIVHLETLQVDGMVRKGFVVTACRRQMLNIGIAEHSSWPEADLVREYRLNHLCDHRAPVGEFQFA